MPHDIIIEKWLEYPERKRNVIFQREPPLPPLAPEKNVIIEWETPMVKINSNLKFSYVSADPIEYMKRYGATIVEPSKIPSFLKAIRPLNGERLATDRKKEKIKLVGNVEALHLIKSASINAFKHKSTNTNIIPSTSVISHFQTPNNFNLLNSNLIFQRNSQNFPFSHNLVNCTQMQPNFCKAFYNNYYPLRNLC